MEINYLKMTEEDAKKYFQKAYELFRCVINKDKSIFDYNFHFDWSIVEKRHNDSMCNSYNENDFYFVDNGEKYALDISHNIDDFGYNADLFRYCYKDIYDDLYCCTVYTYRNYFEYDEKIIEVIFLYDKKNDKVVEVLDISRYSPAKFDKKNIRTVKDSEVLKKILKK